MRKSLLLATLAMTSGMALAQVGSALPPAGVTSMPPMPDTSSTPATPATPATPGNRTTGPTSPATPATPATPGKPIKPGMGSDRTREAITTDGSATADAGLGMDSRFGGFDTDGNGMLSRDEVSGDASMKGQFKSIDKDNDGNVSSAEYQASLKASGKKK